MLKALFIPIKDGDILTAHCLIALADAFTIKLIILTIVLMDNAFFPAQNEAIKKTATDCRSLAMDDQCANGSILVSSIEVLTRVEYCETQHAEMVEKQGIQSKSK